MKLRNLTNEELETLSQDSSLWMMSLLPVLIGAVAAGTPIDDEAVSRYIDFDLAIVAELVNRGLAPQETLAEGREALRRFRTEASS